MMREVSGAFYGSRKLDEALEDLRAEGIAADRVRVASMSGFADFHTSQTQSNNAQTQWIAAEYAGHGEHLGVVDTHDYPYGLDMSSDDILPSFGALAGRRCKDRRWCPAVLAARGMLRVFALR